MITCLHTIDRIERAWGGTVYAMLSTARFLQKSGACVEVLGTFSKASDVEYLQNDYPELASRVFPRTFPSRFSNSGGAIQWFKSNHHRFDVVDIHCVFSVLAWRIAHGCARLGIPYVIRPHGSLDPIDVLKRSALKRIVGPFLIKNLLNRAAAVVLTTESEKERLVTYGAAPKSVVLPLTVELTSVQGQGREFRMRHGIPLDAQVVLFLSRIDPIKGLDILIPALAALKVQFPKLWFVLGGGGSPPFVDQVKVLLAAHRIASWTSAIGFVSGSDKMDAFAGADVFVLPSRKENFGIAIVEAMHAGVPVVVSDQVQIWQNIVRSGAGIACETTEKSVALAVGRMLDGSINLRQMEERGRALVRDEFSPDAASAKVLRLYEDIRNQTEAGRNTKA